MRSYIEEDGKRKEVAGVRCKLDSAEFAGTVITPSYVRMPIVKGKPTAMNISCASSELAGTTRFQPALQGTAVGGAAAAGLVAAVVSTAIVAGRDRWGFSGNGGTIGINLKAKGE